MKQHFAGFADLSTLAPPRRPRFIRLGEEQRTPVGSYLLPAAITVVGSKRRPRSRRTDRGHKRRCAHPSRLHIGASGERICSLCLIRPVEQPVDGSERDNSWLVDLAQRPSATCALSELARPISLAPPPCFPAAGSTRSHDRDVTA
jgi:hypothetical protein